MALSWKYWTVTLWVSKAVALWFPKSPPCSVKDASQSNCVGCWIEVPSNLRAVLRPNWMPDPWSPDSYGNGPAAVALPGGAAKGAHHELVGN